MNSKQRRARIRAGMPGVIHRLVVMKLMGDAEANHVDSYLGSLRSPDLKLSGFERIVRHVAQLERAAEIRRFYTDYITPGRTITGRIKGAHPSLGARYSGKSAHTFILDEAATLK